MRILASRSLRMDKVSDLVKAGVLAVPTVLLDCSGASRNESPANPVVVVEVPQAKTDTRQQPEPDVSVRRKPAQLRSDEEAELEPFPELRRRRLPNTDLNLSYYPNRGGNWLVEARLSIIRPDGTLEKVIVDPKVAFEYLDSSGNFEKIPGCNVSDRCNVYRILKQKGTTCIRAEFIPEKSSPLDYADVSLTINRSGIVAEGCQQPYQQYLPFYFQDTSAPKLIGPI